MENFNMREHFIQELNNLNQHVLTLAAKTEHAIQQSTKAVSNHCADTARKVIAGDYQIDMDEIKIESICLEILALYQPVASDLRHVITLLKINNEIERAADYAVKISRNALDMVTYNLEKIEEYDFSEMASISREMLRSALDSMVYHDTNMSYNVLKRDEKLDAIHKSNYQWARNMIIKHPEEAGYYLDCLTVSSSFERIGDIATNICEDIIYFHQGKIVRHTGNTNKDSECQKEKS